MGEEADRGQVWLCGWWLSARLNEIILVSHPLPVAVIPRCSVKSVVSCLIIQHTLHTNLLSYVYKLFTEYNMLTKLYLSLYFPFVFMSGENTLY